MVTRGWSTIAMALGLSSWVVISTIGSRIYYYFAMLLYKGLGNTLCMGLTVRCN